MPSYEPKVSFYDYSGGVNYAKAPQHLRQNEMEELVNLIPNYKGHPLCTRPIIGDSPNYQFFGGHDMDVLEIKSVRIPQFRDGTLIRGPEDLHFVFFLRSRADGVGLFVRVEGGNGAISISEGGALDYQINNSGQFGGASVVVMDPLNVGIFLQSGDALQLFVDRSVEGVSNRWNMKPIRNKSQFVPGQSEDEYPRIALRQAMVFGGRVWGIDEGNEVRFSASDDRWFVDDQLNVDRLEKWNIWEAVDFLDGGMSSDGGGITVEPFQDTPTGLASLLDGVVVFKDRSISLWTFPPSANPAEARMGASIDVISRKIGCTDPESIVNFGDQVFFIGNSHGNKRSLYVIRGTQVMRLSDRIDKLLTGSNEFMTAIYDGILYIFQKNIGLIAGYNIDHDCFFAGRSHYSKNIISVSKDFISPIIVTNFDNRWRFMEFDGIVGIDDIPMECEVLYPNGSLFIEDPEREWGNRTVEYKTRKIFLDVIYGERSTREVAALSVPPPTEEFSEWRTGGRVTEYAGGDYPAFFTGRFHNTRPDNPSRGDWTIEGDDVIWYNGTTWSEANEDVPRWAGIGRIAFSNFFSARIGDFMWDDWDLIEHESDFIRDTWDAPSSVWVTDAQYQTWLDDTLNLGTGMSLTKWFLNTGKLEGYYLNWRVRNIECDLKLAVRGFWALNGVDIIFRPVGSIV